MAARCPFLEQLEQMPRLTEARYEDGLGELYTQTDPMEVAQHIFDQAGDIPNSAGLSTLFTTWGQFLDHDLSLTPENEHGETMELGDRDITRSEALDGTGEDGPREFGNAITWQIDGSQIYGSNDIREADVRSFEGGQLRMIDDPTSTHGLLPLATDETVMAGDTSGDDAVFLAGDIRASENPNLLSMHTLFAREHNYWAERLAEANPDWSDQDLFEVARSIVEYELQAITYNEWLPHLIGGALPDDIDYDPNVDGQVSLEFSTAAFRFGHTMVSGHMPRLNEDGSIFGDGHLELLDHFFNPSSVREGGIDALIRGQAAEHAQEVDTQVIDDLNFFLATPDGVSGFSLPALNLIRGADHGMGSYLDVRAQLLGDVNLSTLDPTDFSVITDDSELQEQMAGVYDTVFDVDLWVGGLAETAIAGTQMGPLFTFILSDQFYRTSAADETFGELDPRINAEMLAEIQASGLSDVIIRNTDIDTLQDDPFLTAPRELTFEALVTGSLQDDTLDLAAVETPKSIFAEDGDDVVTITGGTTIGGKLSLGDGADSVMMSSGATRFDIDMGRGDSDESVDLSGTARVGDDVCTDAGDDLIRMDDVATIADDLMTRGGDDRIELSGKASVGDLINAGSGNDEIMLTEEASATRIDAGHGDDMIVLLGSADVESVDGGKGHDVLALDGRHFRIEADSDTGGTIVFLDEDGAETGQTLSYTGIEVIGSHIAATEGDDMLVGTSGADSINALGGDDLVMGLSGSDTLSGGRGDDALLGGEEGDRLQGDAGNDSLEGGSGFDRLAGNSGDDTLSGGSGNDTLIGASGEDVLLGEAGNDQLRGGSGNDSLEGGMGADSLSGDGGDDLLSGGGGNDYLTGGAGADTFLSSTGHDGTVTIADYSAGDILALNTLSEEDVIEILTAGDDTILTSSENPNWKIIPEDIDDLAEDQLNYL